jgi:hypothetical protein
MLRSELVEFERYAESTMNAAHQILQDRGVTARDLKKLDAWQDAQLSRFRHALRQKDSIAALVDTWAIARSLATHVKRKASEDELPASTREVALDMLKRREDRLAHIASRYVGEDSVVMLSHQLEDYTKDQPIAESEILEPDSKRWTSPLFSVWAKGKTTVGSILELPLMPGRALKGVSESGEALTGIRETTADAVQIARELPERIRTEFQIALNDLIEKRTEILEILDAIDSVSTNLRATAHSTHLTATEIQKSLTLARELLPQSASLAAAVERAVNASTELIRAIDQRATHVSTAADGQDAKGRAFDITEYKSTAETITSAANEVRQMLTEIRTLTERNRGSDAVEPQEPFDVRDYGAAAEAIQRGAAEMRSLISELREMSEDDASALRTASRFQDVIDHAALRLIHVVAVVFLLACAYTFLRTKLERKKDTH